MKRVGSRGFIASGHHMWDQPHDHWQNFANNGNYVYCQPIKICNLSDMTHCCLSFFVFSGDLSVNVFISFTKMVIMSISLYFAVLLQIF